MTISDADAGDDQHHEHRERVDQDRAGRRGSCPAVSQRPGDRELRALVGELAEHLDERRRPRPRTRATHESRREPGGARAARCRCRSSVISAAPAERQEAGRARRRRSSSSAQRRQLSTSRSSRRRAMATIRPRPTTTSEAATAITASAKICPSPLPKWRENAISARFAPFSMISSESSTISGLRRMQHAERAGREQEARRRSGTGDVRPQHRRPSAAVRPARVAAEDHAADRGDQQDDRGDLEGEQVVGQEQPPDLARAAERVASTSAAPREAPVRLSRRSTTTISTSSAPAATTAAERLPAGRRPPRARPPRRPGRRSRTGT